MANVLVVDDEVKILNAYCRFLRRDQHDVVSAELASEALEWLKKRSFDVVIADIHMPGMSGIELLKRIHESGTNAKVIIITGVPEADTAVEAIRAGAFDYVAKPVDRKRLSTVVERALEIKRIEDENVAYRQNLEELVKAKTAHLMSSKQRFQAFFGNSPSGMAILDKNLKYLTLNGALARLHNDSIDNLVGRSILELMPDAGAELQHTLESRDAETDEAVTIELANRGEHDTQYALWSVFPLRSDRPDTWGCEVLDLTERRLAEIELERSLKKLHTLFRNTTSVLAAAVETRDPYTAGHQRRVAELASAIAEIMGLPLYQREGLRLAGLVHDLGKLRIPSAILTKPTRLSNAEFSLIKEHPDAGYNILKDIDFPWPIAEIVLQHHERMDGSGYPHQIGGDEILVEARIVAVADVIEAMATNRPYRAALGMDVALGEITKHSGSKYDQDVVEACRILIVENGYELSAR